MAEDLKILEALADAIKEKNWKTKLSLQFLKDSINVDEALYEDKDIFISRRKQMIAFGNDDHSWTSTLLDVCQELAWQNTGPHLYLMKQCHIYDAFMDYIEHLKMFTKIANLMETYNEPVIALGNNCSRVHDIDKLDPVMLVGYSEKFEDSKDTSVWTLTVDNHIQINPHHEDNKLWTQCICEASYLDSTFCLDCEGLRHIAVRELICDKVSRHLQKQFNGKMCEDMWDVEEKYFKNLPSVWFDKVARLLKYLKQQYISS